MEDTYCGGTPIESYANKVILAPMVRAGSLPLRLVSLNHGADIVYSEETVSMKLAQAKRVYDEKYDIVDFLKDGKRVFYTCKQDHPNVLQLGTADAISALNAASVVSRDVNGVDLNMGCPKDFSVQGGMGAALLKRPETYTDILSTLKRNLNNSITCKVRLLETIPETIDMLKTIEKTGVSAIAIHTRYVHERPRHPSHPDLMNLLVAQSAINVPLIVNGDVYKYEDIAKIKKETGASSVMIARGALWNPSVFSPNELSVDDIVREYIKTGIDVNSHWVNTKYTLQQLLLQHNYTVKRDQVTRSRNIDDICKIWDISGYKSNRLKTEVSNNITAAKVEVPTPIETIDDEDEQSTPKKQKISDSDDQ